MDTVQATNRCEGRSPFVTVRHRCETTAGGEQDAINGGTGRESSSQSVQSGWDMHVIETFRSRRGQNDGIQEERRNSGWVSNPQSRQYEYVVGPTMVY